MTAQPTITPTIEMTGAALTAAYASGDLTPVDAAESVLSDIAARNGVINAFTDLDPAQVLQDAAASAARWERGEQRGPLDGLPVTVKENFVRAGIPAHAGVAGTAGVVPERDSPVVERLLEQGAVIVGSTTMPD